MYKYFNMKLETLADLKKEYRELAFKYHPDKGGHGVRAEHLSDSVVMSKIGYCSNITDEIIINAFVEVMAEINNEYEKLFAILKQGKKVHVGNDEYAESSELPEDFINIINAIINLDGIVIKLVGEWLWVTGETAKHKTVFKVNRFRWSGNKKAWYYNPDPAWRKKSRKKLSLGEIENFYGSKRIGKGKYKSKDKEQIKKPANQLALF